LHGLLRDRLRVADACGLDLDVEPILDGGDQLSHDPQQARGGGVDAGGEELEAERGDLVVDERADNVVNFFKPQSAPG
jgi:hypothetical protein